MPMVKHQEPSPLEIYNDLDSLVVNFWRVLRRQPEDLVRLLKATPWAREEFMEAWGDTDGLEPLEKARRLFVRTWMSFMGATGRRGGWRAAKTAPKPCGAVQWGEEERLVAVAQRWRRVQIEHDDALAVIRRFDSPTALLYCDPPYVHSTRTSSTCYTHEMTDDKHKELLDLLDGAKGKVVLSAYPSELYRRHLPAKRWRCVSRQSRTRMPGATRTETLWMKK